MGVAGSIVVFVIAWWLCLLMILPVGHNPPGPNDTTVPGVDRGAPETPRMLLKMGIATAMAVVIWGGLQLALVTHLLTIPHIN